MAQDRGVGPVEGEEVKSYAPKSYACEVRHFRRTGGYRRYWIPVEEMGGGSPPAGWISEAGNPAGPALLARWMETATPRPEARQMGWLWIEEGYSGSEIVEVILRTQDITNPIAAELDTAWLKRAKQTFRLEVVAPEDVAMAVRDISKIARSL